MPQLPIFLGSEEMRASSKDERLQFIQETLLEITTLKDSPITSEKLTKAEALQICNQTNLPLFAQGTSLIRELRKLLAKLDSELDNMANHFSMAVALLEWHQMRYCKVSIDSSGKYSHKDERNPASIVENAWIKCYNSLLYVKDMMETLCHMKRWKQRFENAIVELGENEMKGLTEVLLSFAKTCN
ncbi:hypothetical protein RUND412_005918 [Rhizina undulata]